MGLRRERSLSIWSGEIPGIGYAGALDRTRFFIHHLFPLHVKSPLLDTSSSIIIKEVGERSDLVSWSLGLVGTGLSLLIGLCFALQETTLTARLKCPGYTRACSRVPVSTLASY